MRLARIESQGHTLEVRATEGGFVAETGPEAELLLSPAAVRLLPPVAPGKIVGVGWNFRAHIKEMQGRLGGGQVPEQGSEVPPPVIFYKPVTALVGPGDPIVYPKDATRVEYEGELCVVVGKALRRATPDQARSSIRGWTCGNDVTERAMQSTDKQWWRAKGYDTFAALGPYLETDAPDDDAWIRTHVNGELRQEGQVRDMIRTPCEVLSYVSQAVTLLPGDVVMLGTPPGVGELQPGDVVEVTIDGLGTLSNPVVMEE